MVSAQHGVPHALPGALRRGRARRKTGILCSRPLSAMLRGHAGQLPKLGVSFDGWRSDRWRAADNIPGC